MAIYFGRPTTLASEIPIERTPPLPVSPTKPKDGMPVPDLMVSIPVKEYARLVAAARDLNILRDSYMYSAYGIDSAVARAIFGDKPPAKEGEPDA